MLVPDRAPFCLQYKRTGHIHKDCRVLRCQDCNRYGQEAATDCVHTYATLTNVRKPGEVNGHIIKADVAEASYGTASMDSTGQGDPCPKRVPERQRKAPSLQ